MVEALEPMRLPFRHSVSPWLPTCSPQSASYNRRHMLLQFPRTLHASLGRDRSRGLVQELLAQADIQIDGGRPWDIQVRDPGLFGRIIRDGSLGVGEGYML